MQVSVESISGLEKRLTIQVPSGEIEQEVTARLKSLGKTAKIAGFRPGKVPFNVLKQRYDESVRNEVIQSVIQKTYYEALSQENIRPAGGPRIDPKPMSGDNFEYTVTIEVYPEITLKSFDGVEVTRVSAEISDQDIDDMMEKLQLQRVTWDEVDRGAKEEDRLMINFTGKIDGEEFEGGAAQNHPLVLGSNSMIEGFEEQLTGIKGGESKTIKVSFPEDYWKAELAGKPAEFDVEVLSVAEPKLPELDDEFAKTLGIQEGGIEALKTDVRNNMERELKQKIQSRIKEAVLDALLENNEVDLPKALIGQEVQAIIQQFKQSNPQLPDDQLPMAEIEKQAEKRVKLGLLIAEVVKQYNLSDNSDAISKRVDDMLNEIASTYDEPEKLIENYRGNDQAMQHMHALAMEEEVVDRLLEELTVKEEKLGFSDLMNPANS